MCSPAVASDAGPNMEEYLLRVRGRLGEDGGPVHAVLGGPKPDADTVAATLCLALHLSQRELPDGVCVPVLCGRPCDLSASGEASSYLKQLRVSHSSLLWRDDVDLLKLQHTRGLSLTLLRDDLLDSTERSALEAGVLRVLHQGGGRPDAEDDDGGGGGGAAAGSAVAAVARELLQEAAEHVGALLAESLGEALRMQSQAFHAKHGHWSEELEELRRSWERRCSVVLARQEEAELADLRQLLSAEMKEFSDGEMTVALASVTTDKEDWHDCVDGLKLFCEHHGYDGLVILLSISDKRHHRQQLAVYSHSTDILNQICCELEESSSWSLSGELEAGESLQVYHIPINSSPSSGTPPMLIKEIQDLLKDFVDRRTSVLACHPSSRTSSTEGVAGSIEFSQGSSGINDMDGSDNERAEGASGDAEVPPSTTVAESEDYSGVVGAGATGELVSPDSGMTTIRSSRSSKESSVFLSDDSPVGEIMAAGGPAAGPGVHFLKNASSMGLLSLSPPVPPERRKQRHSRNKSDFDLLSFDPLHNNDQSLPTGGELTNFKSRDGKVRAESSSFSELEELNLLDFSASGSLGRPDSRGSLVDPYGQINRSDMIDTMVPPTPVNSVVGSRPPSSCGVRFFPEDVIERINGLQHKDSVSSSLSETWDEQGYDSLGAFSSGDNTWNRIKERESPLNIIEEVSGGEMTQQESNTDDLHVGKSHQRPKSLEPQLSLITEQTGSCDEWNPESILKDQWNPVTLAYLQLTPPDEDVTKKPRVGISEGKDKTGPRKKTPLNTLTPDSSKEEDEGVQGNKGDRKMELLDFWSYSAQKGFLKSDSGTTTSYPESLDMWNMTIRDDSLSPLTTPDNLSENSGSFCAAQSNVEAHASLESPLVFSDSGMAMWNTTIQEDSSSSATSPEGTENEKDPCEVRQKCVIDVALTHTSKQGEEDKTTDKWRGNEHNVKIIIEAVECNTEGDDMDQNDTWSIQNQQFVFASEHLEDLTSTDVCEVPGQRMVTSTSEYDNVGAETWSPTSSTENYTDTTELKGQSSPFVAVTKPIQIRKYNQYQKDEGKMEERAVQEPFNQVFLFDAQSGGSSVESKYDNISIEMSKDDDWAEQSSEHSPFVLVDLSSVTHSISPSQELSPRVCGARLSNTDQSRCSSGDWDTLVPKEHDGPGCTPSSCDLQVERVYSKGGSDNDVQDGHAFENIKNENDGRIETMSPSPGSCGEQDTLKCSSDSLHPGSRDDLRSNSDGDSSGLEMEYIIVSGTVKDAEREWRDKPRQVERPSRGRKQPMETFTMLSHAATVLQSQARAARQELQENTEQSRINQTNETNLGSPNVCAKPIEAASSNQYTASLDSECHKVTIQSPDSKSNCGQMKEEDGDDKSSITASCLSPSLRYPSDHFLKTREEVYVHSQISMEDSDEGGQSPVTPKACPAKLDDFQVWRGQLEQKDTPQTSNSDSEVHSPVLSNISVSHSSSATGTPFSEWGVSADRGLGLPFSGDLMEEETDAEERDQDGRGQPRQTSGDQGDHYVEEVSGGAPILSGLQSDTFVHSTVSYCDEKPCSGPWSAQQPLRDHGASQERYSPVLRYRDATSQPSPANQSAALQWTASPEVTQGQTQYGYNYHHIDQRTESLSSHSACVDFKLDGLPDPTDVYAEFTTDVSALHFSREQQAESFSQPAADAGYSSDLGPGPESTYVAEDQCQYGAGSDFAMSQGQTESHDHCDRYQYDVQPSRPEVQPQRGDHAQYVPEEYLHFFLERQPQRDQDTAGMMLKTGCGEEAADEMDNQEDPHSSAEVSAASSQRRKLAAPALDVSLDHSEGSVLSEDALDTEDDALDTGDDLDVSVDELDTPDEEDSPDSDSECEQGAGAAEGSRPPWRSVLIGEQEHRIDMTSIEPYKRVVSHGGYYAEHNAIIVFAACFLPDSNCDNYNYVMENLFLYVISTLELMVAEDYMIVYLNGATPRRRMPGFTWLKKCYQMIDRRLKKNLKMFIIVHPSWFIRTLLGVTRPFISSKFCSKIKYVNSLQELGEIIPLDYVHIPPSIIRLDSELQEAAAKDDRKRNSVV